MTLPSPHAILFDWDNTLVNTWPTIHEALNHCMRAMGHDEWSLEQVKRYVKKSMRDAFPELFGDRWEDAAHIYQEYYRSIHLTNLQALPGALDVLNLLRDDGMPVGVVSNKRGPNLRTECEHLGWQTYFQAVVGADDAEQDKPSAAPALKALKQLGIEPSRNVWFVGDTVIDLECAANLGATAILYGDVQTDPGRYDGHAFAVHLRDHAAFLALLDGGVPEAAERGASA